MPFQRFAKKILLGERDPTRLSLLWGHILDATSENKRFRGLVDFCETVKGVKQKATQLQR